MLKNKFFDPRSLDFHSREAKKEEQKKDGPVSLKQIKQKSQPSRQKKLNNIIHHSKS